MVRPLFPATRYPILCATLCTRDATHLLRTVHAALVATCCPRDDTFLLAPLLLLPNRTAFYPVFSFLARLDKLVQFTQ